MYNYKFQLKQNKTKNITFLSGLNNYDNYVREGQEFLQNL